MDRPVPVADWYFAPANTDGLVPGVRPDGNVRFMAIYSGLPACDNEVKSRLFWYHGRDVPVQALLTAL